MSGYTPLFSSLTSGTLCGRWPDIGLWAVVLSLADRYGSVDVTPGFIAQVTGLATEEVTACMRRFCEPDSGSRSTEENGARLVLIEPEKRNWGWRVVNHAKYREKARLTAKNAREVEDGRNRDRMGARREPPSAPADRRSPPPITVDPLSNANTNANIRDSRPQEGMAGVSMDFHREVIAAYHELLPELPSVKVWPKKRAKALDARIRERCKDGKPADSIAYWRSLFETVAASDFLCGRSGTWRADLEWLITEGNFAKVIEGKYDNRERGNGATHA